MNPPTSFAIRINIRSSYLRKFFPLFLSALLVSCGTNIPSNQKPIDKASLTKKVQKILNDPTLKGARWGILVTDIHGKEIFSTNPDQRFIPASNTKLFTTAAAMNSVQALENDIETKKTKILLQPNRHGPPDLILQGAADPLLSDAPDNQKDNLSFLADAVAKKNIKKIHSVIGDDRIFVDERWGDGWSWNNLETQWGTAVSALSLNDNIAKLFVKPNPKIGMPPLVSWEDKQNWLKIRNDAVTSALGESNLHFEHRPGANELRLYGNISLQNPSEIIFVGIDDPAAFAAQRFRRLLEERGIHVEKTSSKHRHISISETTIPDRFSSQSSLTISGLPTSPLQDDIRYLLKVSQNLHAELLLRRLGRLHGDGSVKDGILERERLLSAAGITPTEFTLFDGSGMSEHNRVTPRSVVKLLLWAHQQPWGETWRLDLPVAGQDGTLSKRFIGTPLSGRLFAKTGTLYGTHALSGYMMSSSKKLLVISLFINDVPPDASHVTDIMDRAILEVSSNE